LSGWSGRENLLREKERDKEEREFEGRESPLGDSEKERCNVSSVYFLFSFCLLFL